MKKTLLHARRPSLLSKYTFPPDEPCNKETKIQMAALICAVVHMRREGH